MATKPARLPLKRKRKSRGRPIGTKFALSEELTGGTRLSFRPPSGKRRGGARNRRDRVSDSLTIQQARNILQSACASGNVGLPLNRHITLHWTRCGFSDAEAGAATSRFLKLASQFMRSKRQPFAFVWVRENDAGDGSKGSHVHILAHVPSAFARQFTSKQRGWLKIVTGQAYRRDTLHTSRIAGNLNAAITSPALHAANLGKVLGYVLKAASPAAREALGLTHPPEYGRVIGKRCGTSENIGSAARKRLVDRQGLASNLAF